MKGKKFLLLSFLFLDLIIHGRKCYSLQTLDGVIYRELGQSLGFYCVCTVLVCI